MPRYKLTIAYDGTEFCGWQKQEPPASEHVKRDPASDPLLASDQTGVAEGRVALRTVQHVVEQQLRYLLREPVVLMGASRTDSGVHAWGQVGAFTTRPEPDKGVGWPSERGTDALVRALNGRLPRDVLVRAAEVVEDDFDPIGGAVEKEYTYTLVSGHTRALFDRHLVFHTWHPLELEPMQRAAALLVGTHDFASFAQVSHGRKTTVRTVFACGVEEQREGQWAMGNGQWAGSAEGASALASRRFVIRVRGDGFLYNMVRILAGTLMEAGRGAFEPARVPEILAARDRTQNPGPTLPPQGLRLEWIRYVAGGRAAETDA
jgi:tRNA pseudouridine38-40 synthase